MNDAANEHYSMLFIDEERQQGRQNQETHSIRPSLMAVGYRHDYRLTNLLNPSGSSTQRTGTD